jgi:hypothetical protein
MNIHGFTIETELADFRFVRTPDQIRHLKDLPNWSITLYNRDTKKPVKLYVVVRVKPHSITVDELVMFIEKEVCAPLYCWFSWQVFIREFGNLDWLEFPDQLHRGMSKDRSVAVELQNFFTRRGRSVASAINAFQTKCSPITLAMESDLVFTTSCEAQPHARRRGISGEVTLLNQHHYFTLQHPIFDLSRIMVGADARKIVTQHLRKAFPFINSPVVKDWTFDGHVQGK